MVEHKLNNDEKNMNKHGPMHSFKYTKENLGMNILCIHHICYQLVFAFISYLFFLLSNFSHSYYIKMLYI